MIKTTAARRTKKAESSSTTKLKISNLKAIKNKQTRVEILQHIAEATGLKRRQVEDVWMLIEELAQRHMMAKGSGEFRLPGRVKLKRIRRGPTQKRKMISPLTGTEVIIPAKAARNDIKAVVQKKLKESVLDL